MLLNYKFYNLSFVILLFSLSGAVYSQSDSTFVDKDFYYTVTVPHGWKWEQGDSSTSPLRLFANSPDKQYSFTILAFKSDKGDIDLARLAMLLESIPETKNNLGDRVSSDQIKRYGQDAIEKRYEKKGFFGNSYTTAEYITKREFGFIFIYTSENKNNSWQEAIRQSIVFNFPEKDFSKFFRFLFLLGAVIFLVKNFIDAAEPFHGKKSLWVGLVSVFLLLKRYVEILRRTLERNRMRTHLKNCEDDLTKIASEVNPEFEKHWKTIQAHIAVKN